MLRMVALLALAAPAPAPQDAAKEDLKKLEGSWVIVRAEIEGKTLPATAVHDLRIVFEGGQFTSVMEGTKQSGHVTLDPSKKPRTMDIKMEAGPQKGQTQPAVYEVDGDSLTICGAEPGKERPTDFTTEGKPGRTLLVFKREKK